MATSQVPFVLADAVDTFDPAIQRMWINRNPKDEENYKKICNVESGVTDYNLKESDISDLSLAGRITENAAVVGESPVQGLFKALGKLLLINGESPLVA